MNSTENIREGPCVIDPFKVRLNQKLKIDVNFLFFLIFYQKKYERARNLHFLRRLQAGHWRGGIRNLPLPSPSPSLQPCFTVWRLKCRYGYITRSNMLQYEV